MKHRGGISAFMIFLSKKRDDNCHERENSEEGCKSKVKVEEKIRRRNRRDF